MTAGNDLSGAVRRAEALAASLLVDAAARRRPAERRQAARMARLLGDPDGRAVILALTDEVLRIRERRRAARVLGGLTRAGRWPVDDWRSARYLGGLDRAALVAGGRLGPGVPWLVVPAVRRRVQAEMAGVILPADRRRLARYLDRRRREGIRLNVNVLGEAVLGEDEAERRLEAVLEMLDRPTVDYVSVKISSICSQLDVLAFDDEVGRIAVRLRRLYDRAQSRRSASGAPKFVNLDMEEYRDLDLTARVFRQVLAEEPYRQLEAGIVLQAYLPDSLGVLDDLCGWAARRRDRGGAPIKVRIVKGANLAMETVEAEIHGWPRAPFEEKVESDANYKRMLARTLDPALDGALRVGVASHNLFEVAWAAVQAEDAGAAHRVEFEMLEGMSPAVAEAVAARFGGLLLYAPVVRADDVESAIAYLVRRLDENSGSENFLAHQFDMTVGSQAWEEERQRFRRSLEMALPDGAPATAPPTAVPAAATTSAAAVPDGRTAAAPPPATRRTQSRPTDEPASPDRPFRNEPDTDFTRRPNRDWAWAHVRRAAAAGLGEYRPLVDGRPTGEPAGEEGTDPGHPGAPAYRWAPASEATVEAAVAAARRGRDEWRSLDRRRRRRILLDAGTALARARGRLLAVMAADAAKTVREGDPEVSEAVDFARYYAERIPDETSGFEPYGTVVVVSPWNFPLSIPAGGVLGALAAGNTVILKPAPESVAVAGELARVLWDSGIPASALQFVPCVDGDASRSLITSPDVDAVILTGSWDTAALFHDWKPGLRLHAETSGKNAMVVTATADPDQAIADLVQSAFGHAGQKCSAASLAILEAAVYDDGRFLRRLADAVRSLRVGPPDAATTVMGPLIRPPEDPLATALRRLEPGESWLVEPRALDRAGYLWSPGVKVGVGPGSSFHLTECFGPVLGVMRAPDLDTAIAWQRQPDYGLTAGLQALDPAEIEHWRATAEAGNLYVNRGITGAIVGRQPFGGWKRSVVGPGAKAGGPNYVAGLGTWPSRPGPAPAGPVEAALAPGALAPGALAPAALAPAALAPAAPVYGPVWQRLARPADPTALRAESNVFRYRPLRRVAVLGSSAPVRAAADAVGVQVVDVVAPEQAAGFEKLRILDPVGETVMRAARATGVWVDAAAPETLPERELLHWVREQAVSESRHRHGNVTGRRPGLLPPG